MKTIKEIETVILPLDKCPEYAAICAHWSYLQWYLKRDIPFDVNLLAYNQRAANDSLPRVFVAFVDSFPVGMVSLKQDDMWSRKDLSPWLSALYVIPEFRKVGLGDRLITCVTDEAAIRGFKELFLFLDHNEEQYLAQFYEKRGWQYLADDMNNDNTIAKIYRFSLQI